MHQPPLVAPPTPPPARVVLVQPRGFCAGVVRAVDIVEKALALYEEPVYVRKEIVHNRRVVEDLRAGGALFVEELTEVPDGAVVIFSAHGVAPAVRDEAARKNLRVIDATCPLVTKVHSEALRYARAGRTIVLIGHKGHDEVIGTMGEAPAAMRVVTTPDEVASLDMPDPAKVAYLTQTTLSVDDAREIVGALRSRFPDLRGPKKDDICYATQNRQSAVKRLAEQVDLVLVIGAYNSSNSLRLTEVARSCGVEAHLIEDAADIEADWVAGGRAVGITAGASTPEVLVEEVVSYFRSLGVSQVDTLEAAQEEVRFSLPAALKQESR
ncbi:MAG: 4-hydroxy-3-methylbut-2-enyl diphosphate reductase [Armatimonadetes bacterium CG_4_10_14_3_um_filter_66_18]|nr:4-hydroxy-3-methylbut-2-enyl diphosphate reductase [Armatimonadota bacterium]OIP07616.1 MAG: 4-hydroxy-3-methylbut-2-enyl diphosphate reductase [Armatimonadetes bacterium CG2_30_66_41]PIU94588.1 MAG: 4-hydroxy-3-methylbut-2-enyl diphosphate reductase [Armatimonadetes bacterium CG06_land_8_20_14_3_00_66_21]PIW14217.1 MAG: 4-hydroxy-3-methylbut-2-enyl diphosphate reductase [Armatimonadetes bacterium CG17_big_fil_post_rev_8_21_14_2_50_66_6]PIX36661.1 MAG: 4-hydroxy-3-methylbut-2-enyl diphosphat